MTRNIWLRVGMFLCILSSGIIITVEQSIVVVGRPSDNSGGQLQTFSLPSDGVLRRTYTKELTFTPLVMAIDPTGKWIAISSKLSEGKAPIYIFSRRDDGVISQVHQHDIEGGSVISVAYHPSGKWIVASTPSKLFLFQQNKAGSLTEIPQEENLNFDSRALVYNSSGTLLGTLSNSGRTITVFSQNNSTLQRIGSISIRYANERFKALCFNKEGNIIVSKEKLLPAGHKAAFIECYTINAGQLQVSPKSFSRLGEFTSLSASSEKNRIAALLVKTKALEKEEGASIFLLTHDANQCFLKEIGNYGLPELKGIGKGVIKYDDWGEWAGVINESTGDFVLFKQEKEGLKQVNTYSFGLKSVRFDFLFTKKQLITKTVREVIPVQNLPELISDFVVP